MKPEAKKTNKVLKEFRLNAKEKAEHMIFEYMPTKITTISEVIENGEFFKLTRKDVLPDFSFADARLAEVTAASGVENGGEGTSKKRQRVDDDGNSNPTDNGRVCYPYHVTSNKVISDFHAEVLKKEIQDTLKCVNAIKVYIQLNIPRIEDGGNFGVGIQEETVNELSRSEDNGFAVLDNLTKYYVNRAKLTTKLVKYPKVMDYRQSVIELDSKEHTASKICLIDIRNNYATLLDLLTKNWEKLEKPRSTDNRSMY